MRAAIVDVGSNSIKLLVADRGQTGVIEEVLSRTLEVRIGSGIGSESPSLGEEAIARGVAAVTELVTEARLLGADRLSGVATSAVRDASNGAEFIERVRSAAGIELRILSGLEEADGIGRGLTTDPALAGLSDFHVYDLGGGSLECLSFKSRRVERAVSLPLGCVRLTEMLVADPTDPLPDADAERIRAHVKEVVTRSGFPLPVPPGSGVVGTGGTLTTVRSIQAARTGTGFARSDPLIPVSCLRDVLRRIGSLPVGARCKIPGLPASRADVFPTALVTLLALADLGDIRAFRHSLRNLRWGLAAALLA